MLSLLLFDFAATGTISTSRKMNQRPEDPRKHGCGRAPAPVFSGFSKLFRDLLTIVLLTHHGIGIPTQPVKPQVIH